MGSRSDRSGDTKTYVEIVDALCERCGSRRAKVAFVYPEPSFRPGQALMWMDAAYECYCGICMEIAAIVQPPSLIVFASPYGELRIPLLPSAVCPRLPNVPCYPEDICPEER